MNGHQCKNCGGCDHCELCYHCGHCKNCGKLIAVQQGGWWWYPTWTWSGSGGLGDSNITSGSITGRSGGTTINNS